MSGTYHVTDFIIINCIVMNASQSPFAYLNPLKCHQNPEADKRHYPPLIEETEISRRFMPYPRSHNDSKVEKIRSLIFDSPLYHEPSLNLFMKGGVWGELLSIAPTLTIFKNVLELRHGGPSTAGPGRALEGRGHSPF